MSFFQNVTRDLQGLGLGDRRNQPRQASRDYGPYGPAAGPSPAQFQAAPPPPPPYQPPSDRPPLPPGWTPLFDPQHQRWYYVDDASGRAQWEAPGYAAPPLPPAAAAAGRSKPAKGAGVGGVLLGAAGGLAAGALLHEALDDSDDEHRPHRHHGPPAPHAYVDPPGHARPSPPVLPPADADGRSVSSSDREEVEDARDRYEEAVADAADSDASSSEAEELEEARDEYEDEYEETYGGDGGDDYDDYGGDYDDD